MKNFIKRTKSKTSLLKFDLKMRLSVLLLSTSIFVLQANESYAQRTKVTLDLNNITVEQLIDEIENKTEFRFLYLLEDVNLKRIVSVKARRKKINSILGKVFSGTETICRIYDRQISLIKRTDSKIKTKKHLQISVQGKVTDKNGDPLPGASIVEKGTTNGTQSDFEGNFTLEVPDDAQILVVSHIGFMTQEILINGQAEINVQLVADATKLDEVVLTGIRAAQQRAIAVKKTSPVVMDVITSEDVGKLPDRNISEALQRVSGVAIQRTRGQGDFVSIRGLGPEFVRGSINGRTLVSATESFNPVLSGGLGSSTGRATNFDVLPSEIIETIEVFKTNAAEHVEGGLAGTVNIKTAKPLKLGNKYGLSARTSYYEFAETNNPSFSGFGSWVNKAETFGFAGSVTYSNRKIREDATRTYAYFPNSFFDDPTTFDTNSDGTADTDINDPYFPFSTSLDNFNEERKRLTISGTIEWKLSDNSKLTADGSYSKRDLNNLDKQSLQEFPPSFGRLTPENGYVINPDKSVQYPLGLTVDASNTAVTFGSEGYVGSTIVSATDQQISNDKIFNGGVNFNHKTDSWDINLDASLSSTTSDFSFERASLRTGTVTDAFPTVYQVNLSNGILEANPTVRDLSNNIIDLTNVNNYATHNFDIRNINISDTEFALKTDFEKSLNSSFFSDFKFGARYRTRNRENKQEEFFGQLPFTEGGGASLLRLNAGASSVTTSNQQSNFLNGDYNGVFDTSQLVFVSSPSAWRQAHIDADAKFPVVLDPNNTYDVKENTLAGYLQLNIDGTIGSIPVTGNAGVRLVNTNIETNGSAQELAQVPVPGSAIKFAEFIGTPASYTQSESYFKALPSINLKFQATEDIFVRASYSQSITRPQFNDLAGVSINFTQNIVNKAGNPSLKPYESSNIDFGMEWYTGKGGFVGISFFNKQLSNFVTNVSRSNVDFIGNTWTSFLTRENQGEGKISGTEISYQQPFSFLSGALEGFGIIANFTFANGEQTLNNGSPIAFPGVSDFSFNSALDYDKGGKFNARFAYTYRDQFLMLANDVFGQEQWVADYGQLDASASYKISDVITVFGEAINLSNSRNKLFTTNASSPAFNFERPISVEHVGMQLGFGIRAIF